MEHKLVQVLRLLLRGAAWDGAHNPMDGGHKPRWCTRARLAVLADYLVQLPRGI
jgi:hypothetical protein